MLNNNRTRIIIKMPLTEKEKPVYEVAYDQTDSAVKIETGDTSWKVFRIKTSNPLEFTVLGRVINRSFGKTTYHLFQFSNQNLPSEVKIADKLTHPYHFLDFNYQVDQKEFYPIPLDQPSPDSNRWKTVIDEIIGWSGDAEILDEPFETSGLKGFRSLLQKIYPPLS